MRSVCKKSICFLTTVLLMVEMIYNNGLTIVAQDVTDHLDPSTLSNDQTMDTLTPVGTTVNVFDYWSTTNQYDPDGNQSNGKQLDSNTNGINKDHVLKFTRQADDDCANKWVNDTHTTCNSQLNSVLDLNNLYASSDANHTTPLARQGIVEKQLVNGYPTLNFEDDSKSQSLDYLFNPSIDVEGKASYTNVNDLFYTTNTHNAVYYEFDSAKHYAYLNRQVEGNYYFQVYDQPHIQNAGKGDAGQFLPLVKPELLPSILNGDYDQGNAGNLTAMSTELNHYFGLTMTTRFLHTNGGKVSEGGADVVYEFSGDDDVWIFLDNQLVVDLGGIRDKMGVRINFATGTIKYLKYENGTDYPIKTVSFNEIFDESVLSNDTTFHDNTYHTLRFFYLERGHVDSNLRLTFNFITVPESNVYKLDELGNGLEGAKFNLYHVKVNDLENYQPNLKDLISTGTTDENGLITLVDTNGDPLILTNVYSRYNKDDDRFLLIEESSDAVDMIGKRKGIKAVFRFNPLNANEQENQYPVLLSDSIWDQGVYASPTATIALTSEGMELYKDHPLYAVVLGKDANDQWAPIVGNFRDGYDFLFNDDPTDYMYEIKTMLDQYQSNPAYRADNLTIGQFQISTDGSYRTTLNDLPGDITTYDRINTNTSDDFEPKFRIAYFYLDNEQYTEITDNIANRFTGVFSTRMDVPNATNRFFVEKRDSIDQKAINGAVFGLFHTTDINRYVSDGVLDRVAFESQQIEPYMSARTSDHQGLPDGINSGVAIFNNVDRGEYYLIELSAPTGYEVRDEVIPVTVDEKGVHVDALKADDGITVAKGVGFVVSSVERFATADDIDSTLHDIMAIPYGYDGSIIDSDLNDQVLHLTYDDADAAINLDYKASFSGGARVLVNDQGTMELKIQQCKEHDSNTPWKSDKQDLENTDISNLFSGTTIVRIENDLTPITVDIPFTKTVKSEYTQSETFTFSFTLSGDGLTNGLTKEMAFLYPGSETSDTAAPDGSTNEENSGQTTEFTDELPMDTIAETVHDNESSKISVTQESPEASTSIPTEIPVTSETPEVKETSTVSSDPTIDPTEQATDMVETPASSDSVIETTDIPLTTEDTTTGITPNTLSSIRPIGFKQHLVDAVLNQNDGTDASTTVQQNDTFSLTINQPGTYTYTLRENSVSGDSWQYDSTIYKISITVERKGNGLVETNRVITNMTTNEVVSSIEFINELHFGSINNTLTVTKLFNDGLLNPTGFTIMIEPLDNSGATNAIEVTSTDGVTTVLNGRYASAGSYQYKIYESVDVNDSTIDYDDSYYIVTDNVDTVMVNGSATLQLNRTIAHYNADGSPISNVDQIVFNNSTSSPLDITLSKVMENYDIASNPFSFELLVKTNEGYEVVSGPITNGSDGTIHFHIDDYFNDDGSYDFMVQEINDGRDHVTYANPIYVHAEVSLDDNHHLTVETTMSKDGIHYSNDSTMATFINTYHDSTNVSDDDNKPSNDGSINSSCSSLDLNCDGVITCEESYGPGWIWDETIQTCKINGSTTSGYQLVNTKDE